MKTVYKYPLLIADVQEARLPLGAQLLSVQMQNGHPCLWALVDTEAPKGYRKIIMTGTGTPAENVGRHISTFQMNGGALVWHVFEPAE
jgi:hypothetical protein